MIQIEPVMTRGQNIVRVIGPAAQMQKEDEMHADLRESQHDQPDRYAWGPQQIRLRDDERRSRIESRCARARRPC